MTQKAGEGPRLTPLAMAADWNCLVQWSTLQPLPSATPLHMAKKTDQNFFVLVRKIENKKKLFGTLEDVELKRR